MTIIDRYILRHFFINFAILLAVLMLLFVLVDFIVTLDQFVSAGREWSEEYGGTLPATLMVLGDYFGPVLTLIYVFCAALPVIGAMGFTLAGLQRSREATAVVASGVSLYRVAAPILIAGVVLGALVLPLQEYIIPQVSHKLTRSKSELKYLERAGEPLHMVRDASGALLSAASFEFDRQMLRGVTIHERDERGVATRRITATQALWEPGDGEAQPEGWRLVNGYADELGGMAQALERSGDTAPMEVTFFETGLSPEVLVIARQSNMYPWFLSLNRLRQMEANPAMEPARRAEITRIIWGRFSLLVVNILVMVMGLSCFLQIGQMNLIGQAMIASGVCLSAWGGALLVLFTGAGPLNPVAAAWLPVAICLPIAAAALQFVRT